MNPVVLAPLLFCSLYLACGLGVWMTLGAVRPSAPLYYTGWEPPGAWRTVGMCLLSILCWPAVLDNIKRGQ